jgi:hypothetical protein
MEAVVTYFKVYPHRAQESMKLLRMAVTKWLLSDYSLILCRPTWYLSSTWLVRCITVLCQLQRSEARRKLWVMDSEALGTIRHWETTLLLIWTYWGKNEYSRAAGLQQRFESVTCLTWNRTSNNYQVNGLQKFHKTLIFWYYRPKNVGIWFLSVSFTRIP